MFVLPQFMDETLFSWILSKCFFGQLITSNWRVEQIAAVVFQERVKSRSQISSSGFLVLGYLVSRDIISDLGANAAFDASPVSPEPAQCWTSFSSMSASRS
jgi:hypothetical protein